MKVSNSPKVLLSDVSKSSKLGVSRSGNRSETSEFSVAFQISESFGRNGLKIDGFFFLKDGTGSKWSFLTFPSFAGESKLGFKNLNLFSNFLDDLAGLAEFHPFKILFLE